MKPLTSIQGVVDSTGDEQRLACAADRTRRAQEDVACAAVRALQAGEAVLTTNVGVAVVLHGEALADLYRFVREWREASAALVVARDCVVLANLRHAGRA
jgi:hypothetical protein